MVLVVEDDEDTRFLCTTALVRMGYRAAGECDGERGIEAALRLQPHAVLMDVGLPVLNGTDATRLIEEGRRSPRRASGCSKVALGCRCSGHHDVRPSLGSNSRHRLPAVACRPSRSATRSALGIRARPRGPRAMRRAGCSGSWRSTISSCRSATSRRSSLKSLRPSGVMRKVRRARMWAPSRVRLSQPFRSSHVRSSYRGAYGGRPKKACGSSPEKIKKQRCEGEDLNLHGSYPASTSS